MPVEPSTFGMYTEIFEIPFEMEKCGTPHIDPKPVEKVGRYTTNCNVETLTPSNLRWTLSQHSGHLQAHVLSSLILASFFQ